MREERYPMRSIDRVATILTCLAERRMGSISQISSDTGLPRPTVLRLLDALARHGFVAKDIDSGYRLGPNLVRLVMQSSGLLDLKRAARRAMEELADHTRETVALQVLVGSSRMCIEQIESCQEFRRVIQMNEPLPIHNGASGKTLLAWLPESRVREVVGEGPFERFTDRTVTDLGVLLSQLRDVRKAGYAVSLGEGSVDGVALAAPILASSLDILGAITVLAPIHRMSEAKLLSWAPLVMKAATEIAIACGGLPPTGEPVPGEATRRWRRP